MNNRNKKICKFYSYFSNQLFILFQNRYKMNIFPLIIHVFSDQLITFVQEKILIIDRENMTILLIFSRSILLKIKTIYL